MEDIESERRKGLYLVLGGLVLLVLGGLLSNPSTPLSTATKAASVLPVVGVVLVIWGVVVLKRVKEEAMRRKRRQSRTEE
ncbi:MAG: hypothetical protein SV253_09600 [Halobacteria archaeon]|nr:hypothetical protein [Halobacteria archaeon]